MKKSILIVDDDDVMVLLLKKLFEKKYIVFTASDGVEAMHYLHKGILPDLIISDLMMENISGHEFIRHLFSSAFYNIIPVVILSGLPPEELSKEYPSSHIVSKPFDPLALKKLVDTNIFKLNHPELASKN